MESPGPAPFNGWYLRGDVGYSFDQMSGFRSSIAPITPGFKYDGAGVSNQTFIGLGFGYQFNNWFRIDVTGEYRTPSKFWAMESYAGGVGYGPGSGGFSASVLSSILMINGYVDIGTWYGFTPFIGAGVGAAFLQFHNFQDVGLGPSNYGASGSALDSDMAQPAWALMAGISYSITSNWKIEFGYRYLDMGNVTSNGIMCGSGCMPPYEIQRFHIASQDVRLGLRYSFAEAPPPAPMLQEPLVTKY
jgi:opacity protein-like surface antigen